MRTFFVSVPSDFSFDQVVGADGLKIGAFIEGNKYHVSGDHPLAQCFNLGLKFDPSLVASDCEEIYLLDHWLEVIVPQLVEEGFTAKRASRALLELLGFKDGVTWIGAGGIKLMDLLMTHIDDLEDRSSIFELEDAFMWAGSEYWDLVVPTEFGKWMSEVDPEIIYSPTPSSLEELKAIPAEEWARIAGDQTREEFVKLDGNWPASKAYIESL